jgi:energy-coupling factor transporter ATP-binding protein EcfA2
MDMFRTVNKELGTTIVIVTHDREISKKVERVVAIRDGKTSSEFLMSYSDKLAGIEGFASGESIELAVFDRAGRVQIPREFLDKMELDGNRVQIHMDEDNRVIISAPRGV